MGCCASQNPDDKEAELLDNAARQGDGGDAPPSDDKPKESKKKKKKGKSKHKKRPRAASSSPARSSDGQRKKSEDARDTLDHLHSDLLGVSMRSGGEGRRSPSESVLEEWEQGRVTDALAANGEYMRKLIEDGDISEVSRRVSFATHTPGYGPPNPASPSPQLSITVPPSPGMSPVAAAPPPLLSIDRCPSCHSQPPTRGLIFCPFCGKKMTLDAEVPVTEDAPSTPMHYPPPLQATPVPAPPPLPPQYLPPSQPQYSAQDYVEDAIADMELRQIESRRRDVALESAASPELGRFERASQLLLDACETAVLLKRELARPDKWREDPTLLLASPVPPVAVTVEPPPTAARSALTQLLKEREHLSHRLSRMPPSFLDPLSPHPEVKHLVANIGERDDSIRKLQDMLRSEQAVVLKER